MTWHRRAFLLGLGAVLVVGLVIGAGLAMSRLVARYGPALGRERVESALAEALHRPVRVGAVRLAPWRGRLDVRAIEIAAGPTWASGSLLRVERVTVSLSITSLWRRELVIAPIRLEDVDLRLPGVETGGTFVLPETIPDRVRIGPVTVAVGRVEVARAAVTWRKAGTTIRADRLSATARPRGGGVDVTASAERLGLATAGLDEAVEKPAAAVRLSGHRLLVSRLTGRWHGQALRVEGDVDRLDTAAALALRVQGHVALGPVGRRLRAPWPVNGVVGVEGTVRGPAAAPSVSARLVVPALEAGPLRATRMATRIDWTDGELALTDLGADTLGGRVEGTLRWRPADPGRTRVEVRARDVSLDAVQTLAGREAGVGGTASVDATVEGDPGRIAEARARATVEARVTRLPAPLEALGAMTVSGEARWTGDAVGVERVEARWGGGRVEVRGRVARSGTLALDAAATADLAALGRVAHLEGLGGNAGLFVTVTGAWPAPSVAGRLRLVEPVLDAWRLEQVDVPFRLAGRTLEVPRASVRLGESAVEATARFTWPDDVPLAAARWRQALRFRAEVSAPAVHVEDVARLVPGASRAAGRVALSGRVEGTATAWQGEGRASSARLVVDGHPVEDVRTAFAVTPTGLRAMGLRLRALGVGVTGDAEWAWAGNGSARLDVGPVALPDLPGILARVRGGGVPSPGATGHLPVSGSAGGHVELTVRDGAVAASGHVTASRLAVADVALGRGLAEASFDGTRLHGRFEFPDLGVTGTADGPLARGGSFRVGVRARDLQLAPLVGRRLPPTVGPVDGTVSLVADLTVPVADPAAVAGEVRLDPVTLHAGGERWAARGPVVVRRQAGTLHVDRATLTSRLGQVSVTGTVDGTGRLGLTVTGRCPLSLAAALRPEVREAEGHAEATVRVRGTTASPELVGEASVEAAHVVLRDYPDPLRDLRAELRVAPSGVRLVSARVTVGGGAVEAHGDVALAGWRPGAYRVLATVRRLAAPPLAEVRTTWDADLEVVGSGPRALVRGTARLLRGRYTADISLLRSLLENRPPPAPAGESGVHLDVRVLLDDHLVVATKVARLTAGGTLQVQGTVASPVLFGTVEVREGKVILRRHEFTLTGASARFTDPRRIDPILDLSGQATIGAYEVTMRLTGRLANLEARFTSTPSLPEEDVLSLVAFGVTREQLGRSGLGFVAGEVAGFVVQDLFGGEGGGLGLDVLEVDTATTGQRTLRVGKEVVPGTTVTYSQGVERTEERRLRVEYQLVGPFVVAGEQDFRGGFGADVLLRLRFR